MSPSTLCFVKDNDMLGRNILIFHKGIPIFMNNLYESNCFAQCCCFRYLVVLLCFLYDLIACQSFLKHCYKRIVARQKNCTFSGFRI